MLRGRFISFRVKGPRLFVNMPAARRANSTTKRPAGGGERDACTEGHAASWANARVRRRELVRDVRLAAAGLGWAAVATETARQGSHCALFTFSSQGTFAQFVVAEPLCAQDFGAQLQSARAANELHALKVLSSHCNLVEVLEPASELLGLGAHCLLTRFCPGVLSEVSPDHVLGNANSQRALLRGILCGVGHMHERQIAHRRISPEHILLPNGGRADLWHTGAQICGFKDAASFALGPLRGLGGARDTRWFAPEMCSHGGGYTEAVDVWATAATVCGTLCGPSIQTHRLRRALLDFGTNSRTVEFTPTRIPDGSLERLLRACLSPNAALRPCAVDALYALEQRAGAAKRRRRGAVTAARRQPVSGDHTRQLARDVRSALEGRGTAGPVLRQHFSESAVGRAESAMAQLQELATLTETPLPTAVVALCGLAVADADADERAEPASR